MKKNEEFLKACYSCIKNAEQYIEDIEELKAIESYGHGYALAAITSEELTKAINYRRMEEWR